MSTDKTTAVAQSPLWRRQTDQLLAQFPADQYNQLLPTMTVADVGGQFYKPKIEVVTIDPTLPDRERRTQGSGEVYRDPRFPDGMVALSRRGLQKFQHAAGIVFPPQLQKPVKWNGDSAHAEAAGAVKKADGTLLVITASKVVDLELEKLKDRASFESKKENNRPKYTPAEVDALVQREYLRKRENMVQNAETKAQSRVIRKILALKDTYSVDELKKPFVLLRFDQAFDPSDPVQARILIAQAAGAAGAMYPDPAFAHAAPAEVVDAATGEITNPLDLPPDTPSPEDLKKKLIDELAARPYPELRDRFEKILHGIARVDGAELATSFANRWREVHSKPEADRPRAWAEVLANAEEGRV